MIGTPRFFRELWTGARETNYGNTVLVHRDDGQWWLGYVQDVDGELFLVDFDASTVTAEWIHTNRLWPHHFLSVTDLDHYIDCSLQVALRDSYRGPMIFRPATVTAEWNAEFLAVRLDENDSSKNTTDCRFVHRGQFVEHLPVPGDGQSFFGRTDGLTFVKHVIDFPAANALRNVDSLSAYVGPACQFTLAKGDRLFGRSRIAVYGGSRSTCFYSVGPRLGVPAGEIEARYGVYVGCRVFVRVGIDTVTFVCVEVHNEAAGRRMSWNGDALKKACNNYLRLHSVNSIDAFPGALDNELASFKDSCADDTAGVGDMSINELSPPILTCLLGDLDTEGRQRTSRVCALWREIVQKYTDKRVVILDMAEMWPKKPYTQESFIESHYREYKLLATLDRVVSKHITTLVLIDDGQHNPPTFELYLKMSAAVAVLQARGIHVRRFIVKNGYDVAAWPDDPLFAVTIDDGQYKMRVSDVMKDVATVCDELVLINYMASRAITESAKQLLFDCTDGHPPTPEMLRPDRKRTLVDLGVAIPILRFRRGEAVEEQCRRFLAAANESCPAVSQQVQQKITALYARWVETLGDADWSGIRKFLTLLDNLHVTDTPRPWETMNLRQLDVSALNNLTFAALHGCYKDDGDEDGDEDDEEGDTEDDDEDDDDYEDDDAVE
ncbi:uncharacterized protein LOC129596840 [Paramacrobiotus metropolitanus]|uniref:uncharacterized protein LOC129596840 n=1 Tax=Paramacrobiotus metropolitanus TaxID=2943436 RepID=UPI0024462BE6|nr:uncharacterized protein LOC129596840 [Paramacrobiotus metropolitanus]